MKKAKKIALVICASNFERHRNIIRATHAKLNEMGGYILYVYTNYGVYENGMEYKHGEPSIYSLLDKTEIDGCIIEANIGSDELAEMIVNKMRKRNIPVITLNIHVEGTPMLELKSEGACSNLIKHLINTHGCTRINLVLNHGNSIVSQLMLNSYKETLRANSIPFDENRVITSIVSTDSGSSICTQFRYQNTLNDAQAIICVHDVCAISLIQSLEDNGFSVPDDIIVCSSNYSNNSLVFKPDITGIDRMDATAAGRACELLSVMMNGNDIPLFNHYDGTLVKGRSCGCINPDELSPDSIMAFRNITLNKINAGAQISSMMRFNDSLEKVNSIDQLAENVRDMLFGIGCRNFMFCINEDDIAYITSDEPDCKDTDSDPFCDTMIALNGHTKRYGDLKNIKFKTSDIIPVEPYEGDMIMLLPIHHIERDYGFMAFINEYIPVDVYNYRICHESIGNNIETLHNQMILRSNIEALDRLHMTDQLTGMYNRYALMRFSGKYISNRIYSIAMLDMDGLKKINDEYGHLAGNNAICILADSIKTAISDEDLVIRYGGDEFLILSLTTDKDYWPAIGKKVNYIMQKQVMRQKLPYNIGVSLGFVISDNADDPIPITQGINLADAAMYSDKQSRKKTGNRG